MTLTIHSPSSLQFHCVIQFGASRTSMIPGLDSSSNRQSTSPPSSSKLPDALRITFSKVYFPSSKVKTPVGARPMKTPILASLLVRFASSVTNSSGSTVNERVWSPMAVFSGTVQLTIIRCSLYEGMAGTVSRILTPSGVMTSISVAGEVNTPRFCAGMENESISPGNAAYPMA